MTEPDLPNVPPDSPFAGVHTRLPYAGPKDVPPVAGQVGGPPVAGEEFSVLGSDRGAECLLCLGPYA